MKAITSRDNPLYKRLKALAGSTHQQRRGEQALLEGFHLASAYLDAAGQPQLCVVTDGALAHEEARGIVSPIQPTRVFTLPDVPFGQLSNGIQGVGLLPLVPRPAPPHPGPAPGTSVAADAAR
ncbi:RNA methyltransferase, partial [Burkholderia pseudomallei]